MIERSLKRSLILISVELKAFIDFIEIGNLLLILWNLLLVKEVNKELIFIARAGNNAISL